MKKNNIISFLYFSLLGVSALFGQSIDSITVNVETIKDSISKQKYVRIFDHWEVFHKIEVNGNYCYKIFQNENLLRDSLTAYFTEEEQKSISIEVKDSTLFLTSNYKSDFIDSLGIGIKSDTIYLFVKNITDIFGFGNATICANLEGNDFSQYNVKVQGVSEYKGSIIAGNVNISLEDASVVLIDLYTENLSVKMNNACEMYASGYADKSSFFLKSHSLLSIEDLAMSNLYLDMTDKSKTVMSSKKQNEESEEEVELYIEQKISSDSELIIK